MKWFLLVFVAVVAVEAGPFNGRQSYHESVGIPLSESIKQRELAADSSRIVGGTVVPLGQHPFMVGIVIYLHNSPSTSMCGASLLTHTRSLTAAHCWHDGWLSAYLFTLVFGSQTLHTGGLRIDTQDIEMHPDWSTMTLHNDIAIVRHDWVDFNDIIRPINLPTNQANNDFAGSWAVAVGYGRQYDTQTPIFNPDLREAHLQVIPNQECNAIYPGMIVDTTLCTRGPVGTNICLGDSGGPLALGTGSDQILIGVVSFGAGACEGGHPAGYARVTSFLPWILSRD
ncbi:collagenase-like [Ostrinia furnacalis]|uniref:collagenase-like n=1 Tax=Ostrinia furnacalis TaxID=93504 RepID=UPI00103E5EF6|nr:collagenase-like [Ostrinia furnacalis]